MSLRILLFAIVLGAVGGCGGSEVPRRTLVLTGSSTVAPLAGELAKRFEARNEGVRIDVQTGGSSRGVTDAREGTADIGMVSRELRGSEEDLRSFTIARDGIGMIVHADNPVQDLTDEQIVAIYTGRAKRWSDVGGPDAPITVVTKAAGRSTLELFLKHFDLDELRVRADVVIGDNEQGVKTVAGNPHAVGYVSIGTAEYDSQHGVPIRLLGMHGVPASTTTVRDGRFPLARPLNLVTRERPEGLAAEFIRFARSAEVHDLVKAQYFVPLAAGHAHNAGR
jgi:phosphate transport system substrate-binding protein